MKTQGTLAERLQTAADTLYAQSKRRFWKTIPSGWHYLFVGESADLTSEDIIDYMGDSAKYVVARIEKAIRPE